MILVGKNPKKDFLSILEELIQERIKNPNSKSYISKLFNEGIDKIAQKVGEEATELL